MVNHLDMGWLSNTGRSDFLVLSLTEHTALYSEENSHGMFAGLHLIGRPAKYSFSVL